MNNSKKILALILSLALASGALSGCGSQPAPSSSAPAEAPSSSSEAAPASSSESSKIASSGEMAPAAELDLEGLTPVSADSIKDGVYSVSIDSSSTMFKITSAELTVKDGAMTAKMVMGGKGYLKVFMGTGEEALKAEEGAMIPFEELASGEHAFTIPVEALDAPLDCSAFSKKKEKWYDRVLVVRADSLPLDAFKNGTMTTVESLKLADGKYTANVTLEGGSGKASVKSPAVLTVKDGKVTASIVWSSTHYDYMKVDGTRYDALTTEGGSAFEIPVAAFDWPLAVIADTTAMSTPHEIEYTLTFDSASLAAAQ